MRDKNCTSEVERQELSLLSNCRIGSISSHNSIFKEHRSLTAQIVAKTPAKLLGTQTMSPPGAIQSFGLSGFRASKTSKLSVGL